MTTLTLIHHTDLDTIPDKRFWDGECWVQEPRFYPPAVEARQMYLPPLPQPGATKMPKPPSANGPWYCERASACGGCVEGGTPAWDGYQVVCVPTLPKLCPRWHSRYPNWDAEHPDTPCGVAQYDPTTTPTWTPTLSPIPHCTVQPQEAPEGCGRPDSPPGETLLNPPTPTQTIPWGPGREEPLPPPRTQDAS